MHADEFETSVHLVYSLIKRQFPQWKELSISPVASAGTDNDLYRLGDSMVVRLPRIANAAGQVEKEFKWLPQLKSRLPLEIPEPLAVGEPDAGYPWKWAVNRWLPGESVTHHPLKDLNQSAAVLADFLHALQSIDTKDAPLPGNHNFGRGVDLGQRDEATRHCIQQLAGLYDPSRLLSEWEIALELPVWDKSPVWIHGDIQSGNLLAVDGRLSAVIDFGGLAVGDPACDLMVAWNLLTPQSRRIFRKAMNVDDAAWLRGRGWALSVAVIALPYYVNTNPVLAEISRRTLDEILAEMF